MLIPWLQSPLLIGGIDQENLTHDAVDQSKWANVSSYMPSAASPLLSTTQVSPEKDQNNRKIDLSSDSNALGITDSDGRNQGDCVSDDNSENENENENSKIGKMGTKLSWKDAWQNIIDNNNNNNNNNNDDNNNNNSNNNNNNSNNNNNNIDNNNFNNIKKKENNDCDKNNNDDINDYQNDDISKDKLLDRKSVV